MSSQKGNVERKRAQKYQNSMKFKNDMHDKTKLTKVLNEIDLAGVCPRCKAVLQWKIKYKKFKPLTVPKKCTVCEMKAIKHAYHTLCDACAKKAKVCAKCRLENEDIQQPQPTASERISNEMKLQQDLKNLPERKRRTVLRCMKKKEESDDPCATDDDKLAKLIATVKDLDLSEDGWEDDSDFSDDETD